jgi:tetratricopeptide (TPR) repeat protein
MCEKFVSEALKNDPQSTHPEALMTLASLRMSQQKPEDALQAMNKCYDIFKDEEIYEKRPPFEFRHNAAKIFMELNEHLKATEIWESLLEEDDTIAEVYYHLGLAYRPLSSKSSLECLAKSKEVIINHLFADLS